MISSAERSSFIFYFLMFVNFFPFIQQKQTELGQFQLLISRFHL